MPKLIKLEGQSDTDDVLNDWIRRLKRTLGNRSDSKTSLLRTNINNISKEMQQFVGELDSSRKKRK